MTLTGLFIKLIFFPLKTYCKVFSKSTISCDHHYCVFVQKMTDDRNELVGASYESGKELFEANCSS